MRKFLGFIIAIVLILRFVNGEERRIENVRNYGHCNWGNTIFVQFRDKREIFFSATNVISIEREEEKDQ